MSQQNRIPTILIVDDTPSNLGVVVKLFEERGYSVSIAQDGEEGLLRARLLQPNLILLDAMMPGLDGFETCRRLKAGHDTRDIPVIFMTALAMPEHKVNGFRAGAVDYVTKPMQIDEVLSRVDTHLKLHTAQRKLAEHNEELECRVAVRTKELAAREREFRTLAENAPDLIARHDRQCHFVYINRQYEDTLGVAAGEVLGKTPVECAPGESDVAAYQERMMTVMATGQSAEFEFTLPDEGAGERYHNIRMAAERGPDDEIIGVLAIGRDVTERRRAERELHLLNRALDNTFDATYLVDTDLRIRYVNEAAVRELGYSREELLSMNLLDIDPNITREMVKELMAQTATEGRFPGTVESQHRRKNGESFPIEVGATTFSYEGETLFLTVVRNITERKEAEQRLHEKSQAIRAVVENSPDTIIRYDSQCRRIYLNPSMEKVFGQPREQLVGTSPTEFSPLPEQYLATIRRTLESGTEQCMEAFFLDAEGKAHWVDLRLAPEFDAEGSVATVLAIGRDITERKRVEDELADREQRYREIFENAIEGMYLLEVTDDGRFRNIDINPALAASTGMPREAMIGQFVDDTVPEEIGRQIVEKYRRCVAAGETITESIELDLPAGKRHYISTITPIRYQGRIHRLIGISRDITELKKAENELQESRAQLRGLTARREAAREEERKYIAREVHDELGQLLTGLQLNVSVLIHKFSADSRDLRLQLRETMSLTEKALDVARNVASTLRPAALDMGIISSLEWLVGRFSMNTGIRCEVHTEDIEIQLDEVHAVALFRIVQESLTNVARHAQASKVDVMFSRKTDGYSLKIVDDGTGFEVSAKKLDSYGLVGIRERALMLGGEVIIESHPGNGTLIEVRIPVNKGEGS